MREGGQTSPDILDFCEMQKRRAPQKGPPSASKLRQAGNIRGEPDQHRTFTSPPGVARRTCQIRTARMRTSSHPSLYVLAQILPPPGAANSWLSGLLLGIQLKDNIPIIRFQAYFWKIFFQHLQCLRADGFNLMRSNLSSRARGYRAIRNHREAAQWVPALRGRCRLAGMTARCFKQIASDLSEKRKGSGSRRRPWPPLVAYQLLVMRMPNRRGSVVKTLVVRPVSSEFKNAPVMAVVSNTFLA